MPIATGPHKTYTFGEFTLDLDRGALTLSGSDVKLRPKAFEVLSYLVEHHGRLVSREELLEAVWGQAVVTDDAVTQCLIDVRKALRDTKQEKIRTVPRRGYVFELPVVPNGKAGLDLGKSFHRTSNSPRWWSYVALTGALLAAASIWWGFRGLGERHAETGIAGAASLSQSIAVLPFADMSPDQDQGYFADGMAEEILNLLAQIPELRVTSRTSAFSFKDQKLDIPTIAGKLNVGHVLEGSVRKSGNRLRITAQLVDIETDAHLWSQTYDHELQDVFSVQDEIAAAVVSALKIELLGDSPRKEKTDPEAYAMYLQGRQLVNNRSEQSLATAEVLLKQALEIDFSFAPAWALLASVYDEQTNYYGLRDPEEGIALHRHAVERALDADPKLGPAHAELAMIHLQYDLEFDLAAHHIEQALALSPGDQRTLQVASMVNLAIGKVDRAVNLAQRAVATDPLSYWAHNMLGWTYFRAGLRKDAETEYRLSESLRPPDSPEAAWIVLLRITDGDITAALTMADARPRPGVRLTLQALAQHALGNGSASDAALAELIDRYPDWNLQIAEVHAFRGDPDGAFDWLERSLETGHPMLPFVLTTPGLKSLHDDRRWGDFLDRMGLPN